jgi:hypothetical protein
VSVAAAAVAIGGCHVRDDHFTQPIAQPPDCVVVDQMIGHPDVVIPACPASGDCYSIVSDPIQCVAPPQLRLQVDRMGTPPAGTFTSARCRLP